MKKQILFLAIFTLAVFLAGTMNVAAQNNSHYDVSGNYLQYLDAAPNCITPIPLTGCADDALHPIQGKNYTYTVNTTSASDDVRWFVVNNVDLTNANDSLIETNNKILASNDVRIDPADGSGTFIYSLGTNNAYNDDPIGSDGIGISNTTGVAHSIDIAWKFFSGLTPDQEVLLVGIVTDDAGCTNNIAVYRIIPKPAFTLDVATLRQNGDSIAGPSDAAYSECVSPIENAVYVAGGNTTPGGTLTVDYGENWIYFIVNGANYFDSWMPNFQITYAGLTQPTIEADWAYAADAAAGTYWNQIVNFANTTPETTPVIAGGSGASAGTVGAGELPVAGGECIVVRVRLDWGNIEHDDATGTVTFAVDGIAYDGVGTGATLFDDTAFGDLTYTDCTVDGFGTQDVLEYDITPRPEIENATAAPVNTETKVGDEN